MSLSNGKLKEDIVYFISRHFPKETSLQCLRTDTVLTDDWYVPLPSWGTYSFFLIT